MKEEKYGRKYKKKETIFFSSQKINTTKRVSSTLFFLPTTSFQRTKEL